MTANDDLEAVLLIPIRRGITIERISLFPNTISELKSR